MKNTAQEDLMHIRSMMERSTSFLSLSGWSGVTAGIIAIAGAIYALNMPTEQYHSAPGLFGPTRLTDVYLLLLTIVLVLAISSSMFFTIRKTKSKHLEVWTTASKLLLFNLSVPLVTGGLFSLALMKAGCIEFIATSLLIFYGLGLVNASKYTFSEIAYLGYFEIVLGLMSIYFVGNGILFWILGFGILHIGYGLVLYFKYR